MKNIFNPHLWNLIKINWSIAWRANVLALTATIIFFGLFSLLPKKTKAYKSTY